MDGEPQNVLLSLLSPLSQVLSAILIMVLPPHTYHKLSPFQCTLHLVGKKIKIKAKAAFL